MGNDRILTEKEVMDSVLRPLTEDEIRKAENMKEIHSSSFMPPFYRIISEAQDAKTIAALSAVSDEELVERVKERLVANFYDGRSVYSKRLWTEKAKGLISLILAIKATHDACDSTYGALLAEKDREYQVATKKAAEELAEVHRRDKAQAVQQARQGEREKWAIWFPAVTITCRDDCEFYNPYDECVKANDMPAGITIEINQDHYMRCPFWQALKESDSDGKTDIKTTL
ncbi:MAG: hypothetical protein PHG35_02145 [Dehalococcoidales bacterium]|nr:hypothetical protein [Dehalococcoidales bacterium]